LVSHWPAPDSGFEALIDFLTAEPGRPRQNVIDEAEAQKNRFQALDLKYGTKDRTEIKTVKVFGAQEGFEKLFGFPKDKSLFIGFIQNLLYYHFETSNSIELKNEDDEEEPAIRFKGGFFPLQLIRHTGLRDLVLRLAEYGYQRISLQSIWQKIQSESERGQALAALMQLLEAALESKQKWNKDFPGASAVLTLAEKEFRIIFKDRDKRILGIQKWNSLTKEFEPVLNSEFSRNDLENLVRARLLELEEAPDFELDPEVGQEIQTAFEKVNRVSYVLDGQKAVAYADRNFNLDRGKILLRPTVIAEMLALAGPRVRGKVLEVGSGAGYVQALLSQIDSVGDGVYGIESDRVTAQKARHLLDALRIPKVHLLAGDGRYGWIENGLYDFVLVSEEVRGIPQLLKNMAVQMAENGALIFPSGGSLYRYIKRGNKWEQDRKIDTYASLKFQPASPAPSFLGNFFKTLHLWIWALARYLNFHLKLPGLLHRPEVMFRSEARSEVRSVQPPAPKEYQFHFPVDLFDPESSLAEIRKRLSRTFLFKAAGREERRAMLDLAPRLGVLTPMIRAYFLHRRPQYEITQISVFGSYLTSPQPGDLDLTVLVKGNAFEFLDIDNPSRIFNESLPKPVPRVHIVVFGEDNLIAGKPFKGSVPGGMDREVLLKTARAELYARDFVIWGKDYKRLLNESDNLLASVYTLLHSAYQRIQGSYVRRENPEQRYSKAFSRLKTAAAWLNYLFPGTLDTAPFKKSDAASTDGQKKIEALYETVRKIYEKSRSEARQRVRLNAVPESTGFGGRSEARKFKIFSGEAYGADAGHFSKLNTPDSQKLLQGLPTLSTDRHSWFTSFRIDFENNPNQSSINNKASNKGRQSKALRSEKTASNKSSQYHRTRIDSHFFNSLKLFWVQIFHRMTVPLLFIKQKILDFRVFINKNIILSNNKKDRRAISSPARRSETRMREKMEEVLRKLFGEEGFEAPVVMKNTVFHGSDAHPIGVLISFDEESDVTGIAFSHAGQEVVHGFLIEEGGKDATVDFLPEEGVEVKIFAEASKTTLLDHWVLKKQSGIYMLEILRDGGAVPPATPRVAFEDWMVRSEARAVLTEVGQSLLQPVLGLPQEELLRTVIELKNLKEGEPLVRLGFFRFPAMLGYGVKVEIEGNGTGSFILYPGTSE
jgi:protein-L-isoaspartate O-methyltransferase